MNSEARFSILELDIQPTPTSVESSPAVPFHLEPTAVISHLMELDDSNEFIDSVVIKEKMAEVTQAIATMDASSVQKSPEVEPRQNTTNVLMTDEPVATKAQAVSTVSNLLAEAEPVVKQLMEDSTMFEPEPRTTVPSTSETIDLPADMGREDSQLASPQMTVKSVVPLVMTTTDRLILEEPSQQELTSDEPMHGENIKEGIV